MFYRKIKKEEKAEKVKKINNELQITKDSQISTEDVEVKIMVESHGTAQEIWTEDRICMPVFVFHLNSFFLLQLLLYLNRLLHGYIYCLHL